MLLRVYAASVALVPATLPAQASDVGIELRTFAAGFIPTGDARLEFRRGTSAGIGLGLKPARHWLAVFNGSWTSVINRYASFTQHATTVWQYDAGVEVVPADPMGGGMQFRPFLGFGGGVRTYDYREVTAPTQSCWAGYGSIGGDVLAIRFGLRGELRQYVSCFKSPISGRTFTRTNLGVSLGLLIGL